ncbi:hypothetical protein Plec18170_003535 [Paecilomyces lecythidis]
MATSIEGASPISTVEQVKAASQDTATPRLIKEPLQYSGSLDEYRSFEAAPVIGTEFPDLQLTDILNDNRKIRDLAIIDEHKFLLQKLGELTGKPATSKLHRNAVNNSQRGVAVNEYGKLDDEIAVISSEVERKFWGDEFGPRSGMIASEGWHADITSERVPPDYASLKITHSPEDNAGGDTLWASGYEIYDRLSPPIRQLVDGLKALHYQPYFSTISKKHDIELLKGERGAPENIGYDFEASHPVVRTNPVTGWKSLFGAGGEIENGLIKDVTKRESEILKKYFLQLIAENHDLQVRLKWKTNDLAIWDNRSTFHTATTDYEGKRQGNRVLSIGEIPYLDPASKSRREALRALSF